MSSANDYGTFRLVLIRMVLAGTPLTDIADLLEVELERFPQEAHAMRREIATYRGESQDSYEGGFFR